MRTFLTFAPDYETALAISRWSELCWPMLDRRIPVQNFHLTVAFLGETDDTALQKLSEIFEDFSHASFVLHLNDIGYWPDSNVLWLGPSDIPDELTTLHKICKQAGNRIGAHAGGKRYQPHLTLARKLTLPPGSALMQPEFVFKVDALQLWSSVREAKGARYDTLATWPLE